MPEPQEWGCQSYVDSTTRLIIREWKHYVKVGLQGHRAIDEEDLRNRISAIELVHEHATAYFRHIGNNCASYTEGVRVFDN